MRSHSPGCHRRSCRNFPNSNSRRTYAPHLPPLAGSGQVKPRPGVLRLMEQARAAGLKLAVCSAATKNSVVFVVEQLLGAEAFQARPAPGRPHDVCPCLWKTASLILFTSNWHR